MAHPKVWFDTNCYEKDWEFLLKTNRLRRMISRNCYDFDRRILIINNVDNPEEVEWYAKRHKKKGVIDDYYFAEEFSDEILDFFKIPLSFKEDRGYLYSISQLCAVYLSDSDFVVHYSADCILERHYPWIREALEIFEQSDDVVVVNPCWDRRLFEAEQESVEERENCYIGWGFSDQCYMIPTRIFKAPIYDEYHPLSERYPVRGGNLFERRVDSWMRNNNKYRATLKEVSYIHTNLHRMPIRKRLKKILVEDEGLRERLKGILPYKNGPSNLAGPKERGEEGG
jgi:hypothetical protein